MARIHKITVSTGIYWIEIPEADLRLLCGCPADAVKHLLRRGLIQKIEIDGVTCESGPNAILLSDLAIQNGRPSNRAEFPVLQMLYLQGMLVPNHPRNKGARPRIIGTAKQVEGQLGYLFHGNYGLASREALIAAGVSAADAEEIMRMKLAFAFGRIRPSEELVEPVVVNREPVTIARDVRLARLRSNVYEIRFGGERVEVDLNLRPGEQYECPYTLDNHLLDQAYFSIVHTGDGDGWDMNGPTMGSLVCFQGKTYLIDAGPNIDYALSAIGVGINEIDGIFHTHCHDDHLAGLTTLMRGDKRITYYAVPMVRASVVQKLSHVAQISEREFDQLFDVRDLQIDIWNDIEGLEVRPVLSPHPVETTIMFFRALWEGGYRSYGHLADIASDAVMKRLLADKDAPHGITRERYEKTRAAYAEKVDVKKIDIGGGLIHGEARDFAQDKSGKLILAHTARRLTPQERAIGSGAPFGTVDVLIEGTSDVFRRRAYEYLHGYFSDVPRYRIRHLLNSELVVLNPETLLIHEGEMVEHLYLVLSGTVEALRTGKDSTMRLSAGSILGESAALLGEPSNTSFRAIGFVRALRIARDLYTDFVTRSALYRNIVQTNDKREFLRGLPLFGDSVSCTTLHRLVQEAKPTSFETGASLPPPGDTLLVLRSGQARLETETGYTESLSIGAFFGALDLAGAIQRKPRVEILEATEAYGFPAGLLTELPGVRWRLLEAHRRRYFDN